jgi:hypothetical protein
MKVGLPEGVRFPQRDDVAVQVVDIRRAARLRSTGLNANATLRQAREDTFDRIINYEAERY